MKAQFIKKLDGFNGEARLYKLTPPLEKNKYVVVSAVIAPFTGAETLIFPANATGEINEYHALEGSYRGGLSHEKALSNAGYSVEIK